MIDWIFIVLLMIALLFTILSIVTDWGIYWNVVFIIGSTILYLALAGGVMSIETPYTIYNSTSGNIEEGFHTTQSNVSPYMTITKEILTILAAVLSEMDPRWRKEGRKRGLAKGFQ